MTTSATITPTGKPVWSREAAIGDYGGALDKEASKTEGEIPYAWFCYREISSMRGSAYSPAIGGTWVHCENLAHARFMAWLNFRMPEKFRANCLPGTADEGVEYWTKVLGIPTRHGEQQWLTRQRCAAHYKAVTTVNLESIQTALQDLLGSVYVDASFITGGAFSTPPTITFWPGVNPGPDSYSLGGGCWASERSHLFVEVTRASGLSDADFHQLVNVQMFQLLDRMLPAFCTFAWGIGDGFILDLSQLDFCGLTPS